MSVDSWKSSGITLSGRVCECLTSLPGVTPRPGPRGTHAQAAGSFGGQESHASNRAELAPTTGGTHSHMSIQCSPVMGHRTQRTKAGSSFIPPLCSCKPSRVPRVCTTSEGCGTQIPARGCRMWERALTEHGCVVSRSVTGAELQGWAMSQDGPSSRPTLCCPFTGTVLGVRGL